MPRKKNRRKERQAKKKQVEAKPRKVAIFGHDPGGRSGLALLAALLYNKEPGVAVDT